MIDQKIRIRKLVAEFRQRTGGYVGVEGWVADMLPCAHENARELVDAAMRVDGVSQFASGDVQYEASELIAATLLRLRTQRALCDRS